MYDKKKISIYLIMKKNMFTQVVFCKNIHCSLYTRNIYLHIIFCLSHNLEKYFVKRLKSYFSYMTLI